MFLISFCSLELQRMGPYHNLEKRQFNVIKLHAIIGAQEGREQDC